MPSGPGERYDFFLSRRGSVAAIAQEVTDVLTEKGYRVLVQDYDIPLAASFVDAMHEAVKNSRQRHGRSSSAFGHRRKGARPRASLYGAGAAGWRRTHAASTWAPPEAGPNPYHWKNGKLYYRGKPCVKAKPPEDN